MIRFQRFSQAATLTLFVVLLFLAAYPLCEGLPVDLFLRLDPLIGVGTMLASRDYSASLVPGIIVLVLALVGGRFFCGHICPMGSTLDVAQAAAASRKARSARLGSYESSKRYRHYKYVALAAILAAGLVGVSLVHLGSPLSLITRCYGLAVYPVALLTGDSLIAVLENLSFVFPNLTYLELPYKVFRTHTFVFVFFAVIVLLARIQPRFWCRNLCPAGALLALCSRAPLIRRRVSEACNKCGICIRTCPTGAISEDPSRTVHPECIACMKCVEICPQSAISFGHVGKSTGPDVAGTDPTRRTITVGLFSGLVAAALVRTGIHKPVAGGRERPLVDGELIRPPGALPEKDFLTRCVRCGECMKACPTNTLQPVWFHAGLEGLFTPVMLPRLAACAVNCNVCGRACPTGAIRNVSLVEKNHAKVGTAWIARENCLVWEQDKKCLVCDEVCPYNAVSFRPVEGRRNAVPFVVANRCTGCGWCESKCPVEGTSAIRVNILGEIRLAQGSYVEKAKEYGFVFRTKDNSMDSLAPETFDLPGFDRSE